MDEIHNEPDTSNIIGVQFSIMSPDEIKNRSVVEISKHDTYDKDTPVIKGLFDIRMGSTEMNKVCGTCHQNNIMCPGHFGHIELASPVYHYHFITFIHKILKCVCLQCSKLLINKDSPLVKNLLKKSSKVRWNELYTLSQKIKRCGQETEDGCGAKQPDKLKLNSVDGIQAVWNSLDLENVEAKNQMLKVDQVKKILEKITDEDVNILGFSDSWCRPEWLICSVLPVPPPSVRPSVKQGDSQRMDDDITHKLCDIVKCNNTLRQKIEANNRPEVINDWIKVLQYHVATLVDNELPGVAQSVHRSGRPLKAIRQRLKGKEGRIRSNLMGKRVDFSGRSVITPDPNIDLDELGVPIAIAKNLTYPAICNDFNKESLLKLLENGYDTYPGIKSIDRKSGLKITITKFNSNDITIENGDVVHRHLRNGDWVLFNRQPSLHRMSMMGHRVRVMKGDTFRLNVSVTTPYNADFDGDEMNMHAPQSIAAVSELINICSVNQNIISPRENSPIITIVQDTLLGINKLTKGEIIYYKSPSKDSYYFSNNTNIYPIQKTSDGKVSSAVVESSYFTRPQMMNLLCNLSTFDGTIPESSNQINVNDKEIPLWSGKDIISYIIPDIINLKMNNNSYDNLKNELLNTVIIKNGKLVSGGLDKGVFEKTSKGLIHTIYNDLGPQRTNEFINDLQKIVSYFLIIEGFSVGIGDMIADEVTNEKIKKVIKENKVKIDDVMQEVHLNIFENYSGQTNNTYFESKVNGLLNNTLNLTGSIGLENLDPKNRATNMVNCGSKGKPTNIAQMLACLGQQNVDGKRIPYGYIDRTLPHYHKYDDSSEARGFVENSFISGQTPQEYFFHAMGGREGLIDTACKTSETGYIQRKLMKSMEDLRVNYDYSVRNSSGCIVQFIYGDDGMDACKVESQPLLVMEKNTGELTEMFLFNKRTAWTKLLTKDTITQMKKDKEYMKKLEASFYQILTYKEYLFTNNITENNVNFPVHLKRITSNVCSKKKISNISPLEILSMNESLKSKLMVNKRFGNNHTIHLLIDIHFHPKILIGTYKIQKEEYEILITTVEQLYEFSKISPGEMVGAVAAQSIGEPATQMTLNTFHYAGVSSKSNVTRGIPRLKELLSVTKNLKAPSVKVFLKKEFSEYENRGKAQFVKNKLEHTVMKDIIIKNEIYFDPKNKIYETDIDDDSEFLKIYKEFLLIENGEDYEYNETAPWILRFTFNKELMMEKGIIMEDIAFALMNYDNEKLNFIYSDDNSNELVGRVSLNASLMGKEDDLMNGLYDQTEIISIFKNIQEDILNNIVIKGIENITNIVMSEEVSSLKKENEIFSHKEWTLETDGTNLFDIFNSEYVDYTRTLSNDVIEIYEVLGIEAARQALMEEVTNVMKDASYINNRHISILIDIMTNTGILTPINRQGINRGDVGPLAKCSFEDTTDQLIKAGIFGEKDKLQGVSSNIMMGQTIKAGTGFCSLLLDEEKLIEEMKNINYSTEDFIEVSDSNIETLLEDNELDDSYCNDDNLKFSID